MIDPTKYNDNNRLGQVVDRMESGTAFGSNTVTNDSFLEESESINDQKRDRWRMYIQVDGGQIKMNMKENKCVR